MYVGRLDRAEPLANPARGTRCGTFMRTFRAALAGTVILALLGGLSLAAVAQEEQDGPITATYVTGEVTGYRPIAPGTWEDGDGFALMTDDQYELQIEWSDPRLPSVKHGRENLHVYNKGDDLEAETLAGTIRLEGPDGAWVGTAHGMADYDAERGRQLTKVMVLDGEDAYEGLHAAIVVTIDEGVSPMPSYEGFIYEGEMPPLPDPVEPFAAE